MSPRYPTYDVLEKWSSVSFDDKTRAVIAERLHAIPGRRFFTAAEWTLVEALSAVLAPTPQSGRPIPITPWIDDELHGDKGEGYRLEGMPPMQEAWRTGLRLLAEEACAQYGRPFEAQDRETQTAFIRRLQKGEVDKARWSGLDVDRFFGDLLLRTIVGVYYAHPQAQSEMGFGGPASPRGYVRIGVNEHDPWEAREARGSDAGKPNRGEGSR